MNGTWSVVLCVFASAHPTCYNILEYVKLWHRLSLDVSEGMEEVRGRVEMKET